MPRTPETFGPAFGGMCVAPWMSWIATGGADVVVKLHVTSAAMLSGGSATSWSLTLSAKTVTLQASPFAKSLSGFSVKVVWPPLCVAVCSPLVAHEIVYQPAATSTGSLNCAVMLASTAMSAAPLAGVVVTIEGAVSPVPLFCGFGATMSKSAELLFVSVEPPPVRLADVVLERVPVGDVSEHVAELP